MTYKAQSKHRPPNSGVASRVDQRRALRNFNSAVDEVNDYFERYPSANVLVLTLNYHPVHRTDMTLFDIRRHRDMFLQNMSVVNAMKGIGAYIAKIEDGEAGGGLHLHIVILYSATCDDDVAAAAAIGDYWVAVTKTKGDYKNSNERAAHYAVHGPYGKVTGFLHRDDSDMMGRFHDYLRGYITKPDQGVNDEANSNGRAFSTSRIAKKQVKSEDDL